MADGYPLLHIYPRNMKWFQNMNQVSNINLNTVTTKKADILTPGVASWTWKLEWTRVQHWIKDWAETPAKSQDGKISGGNYYCYTNKIIFNTHFTVFFSAFYKLTTMKTGRK